MKVRMSRRVRSAAGTGVVTLIVVALIFAVSGVLRPSTPKFELTSGSDFTIKSAIYPSPACSGSTALLYPGVTSCLVYSVQNNLDVPITVQTISGYGRYLHAVHDHPADPPCNPSDLTATAFSGSLPVAASGANTV